MADPESVIAAKPPSDGRDWDNQCARCGSSVSHVQCDACGGEGIDPATLDDELDTLAPGAALLCEVCEGQGGWNICLSSEQFCNGHALPGREEVKRGEIEWYVIAGAAHG